MHNYLLLTFVYRRIKLSISQGEDGRRISTRGLKLCHTVRGRCPPSHALLLPMLSSPP